MFCCIPMRAVWCGLKQGCRHTGTMRTILDGGRQALFVIVSVGVGVGVVVDRLGVGVVSKQRTGLWIARRGVDTADGLEYRSGVGTSHVWCCDMDAEVRDERVMMDKNTCVGKGPFYKFSHPLPSRRGKSTSLAQRGQSEPRPRQWSWQKQTIQNLKNCAGGGALSFPSPILSPSPTQETQRAPCPVHCDKHDNLRISWTIRPLDYWTIGQKQTKSTKHNLVDGVFFFSFSSCSVRERV